MPQKVTIWYADPSTARVGLNSEHPANEPFRQAFGLLKRLFIGGSGLPRIGPNDAAEGQALVLALADYSRARREQGPYSVFHAFRALEDIQYAFPGETQKERWPLMNKALGTTQETWEELTKAGQEARHLDPERIEYLQHPETRKHMLSIARDAITRFTNHVVQPGRLAN